MRCSGLVRDIVLYCEWFDSYIFFFFMYKGEKKKILDSLLDFVILRREMKESRMCSIERFGNWNEK